MAIANAGLDLILQISVPVLNVIYPMAIVLILLSFFQRWIAGMRYLYPVAVLLTGLASLLYALQGLQLLPESLGEALAALPLAAQGLGWLLPAGAGIGLGLLLSLLGKKHTID